MVVGIATLNEIKKKAMQCDAAKKQIMTRIEENVRMAIEKLKAAEKELLDEVEIEFGENIFASLLASINSGNDHTDEEIKTILSRDVSSDFGPDEESFCSLCKEIESFKAWRVKEEGINYIELIPKNIKLKKTRNEYGGEDVSLSWNKVEADCFYEIELETIRDGSSTIKKYFRSTEPKLNLTNLDPRTSYYVRVRTRLTHSNVKSAWSESVLSKSGFQNRKYSINSHL